MASAVEADAAVALVHEAAHDLAERLGVTDASVELIAVEPTEWRDASLGVPQPGSVYAQILTPGYRIVLEVYGARYRYHTDTRRVVYAGVA